MRIKIIIEAETSDEETVKDAVDILETQMPYMFDNVVVHSEVPDARYTDDVPTL